MKKGNKKSLEKIGGQPVSMKVDTGSAYTFITSRTFKNIPCKVRPGLKPTKRKFVAANGSSLDCEDKIVLTMDFGKRTYIFLLLLAE